MPKTRRPTRTCSGLAALATLAMLGAAPAAPAAEPAAAAPPTTARILPARTLAVLVAENVQQTIEALKDTNASLLWQDPEMRPFVQPLLEKLRGSLAEVEGAGSFRFADLASTFRGQVAAAVVGLRTDAGPEPLPELALVAEVGDREAAKRLLDLAGRAIDRQSPAQYTTTEDGPLTLGRVAQEGQRMEVGYALGAKMLCVGLGPDGAILSELVAAAQAGGEAGSLAEDDEFLAAVARAGPAREVLSFLHWGRVADAFFALAGREADPVELAALKRVYSALGLDGVRSVSFSCAVAPPGVRSEFFVHAPAPRKGLFTLLSESPIAERMVALAPEGSRSLAAWKWRPEALLPLARNVAAAADPAAVAQLDQALANAGQAAHAVGSFADEGVIYLGRANVEPVVELANAVIAARVENPDAFRPVYGMAIAMGSMGAATKGLAVKTAATEEGDIITYLPLPLGFSPAATLTKSHLVVATTREGLESALVRLRAPEGRPLASGEDYELALMLAGGAGDDMPRRQPTCFLYYSSRRRAEDFAPYLALAPGAAALLYAASLNADVPQEARDAIAAISIPNMPAPEVLARYSLPSAALGWVDRDGVGFAAWGESMLPGGAGSGLVMAAGTSVLAAAAVPNLLQSRMSANEAAAAAGLRAYLAAQNVFHRTDFYGGNALVYANPLDGRGFVDLYEIGGPGAGGRKLKLIDEAFARATVPATAKAGYYFVDITRDADGNRYDYAVDCGLCAVPARHNRTGKHTLVIDVTGAIYRKDTRGRPVRRYPDLDDGWEPLEVW